ncbi:hypothetical protein [Gymnodinialimonas sp. 57CJ19]|uniref:hypothetical protein n=1 Tax=Gymnodinialimonas sp. 57CJ19 TaxID=3138498 RepID=UPI0031342710
MAGFGLRVGMGLLLFFAVDLFDAAFEIRRLPEQKYGENVAAILPRKSAVPRRDQAEIAYARARISVEIFSDCYRILGSDHGPVRLVQAGRNAVHWRTNIWQKS